MVKNTQTIRRLLPTDCLRVFDYFVGLVLKNNLGGLLRSSLWGEGGGGGVKLPPIPSLQNSLELC